MNETQLLQFLQNNLLFRGAVFTHVPDNPRLQGSGSFVTIEQIGGSADRFFAKPVYALQVWSFSKFEAHQVANTLRDVIALWPERDYRVAYARVTGAYHFPDPETHMERYQLTVSAMIQTEPYPNIERTFEIG